MTLLIYALLVLLCVGDADNERTSNQSEPAAFYNNNPQGESPMTDRQKHQGEYTPKNPDADENVRQRQIDETNRAHNRAEAARQRQAHDSATVGADGEIKGEEVDDKDAKK